MRVDRSAPAQRVAEHQRTGTGVTRIGYPIEARTLRVLARREVTPHMVRVTLGGPELNEFHTYQADDHVKIVFPDDDGALRAPVPNGEQMLDWPRPMPTTRKYTVRRYDAESGELDLDVVLHDGGVESAWAAGVVPGDEVTIAGPPGAKAFAHTYDHYVFAVDATALPAAARWLEESPPGVSADIVIEVDDEAEHGYPLAHRDGVELHRLIRRKGASSLASTVTSLSLPAGRCFLFAAGEAGDIKSLRSWSKERRLDALCTGYWRRGVADLDD